jgi:hypothetical protein
MPAGSTVVRDDVLPERLALLRQHHLLQSGPRLRRQQMQEQHIAELSVDHRHVNVDARG